ncbi:hypothetical protein M0R45_028996 [Rubus argutus]|uniref:Leucine-rich repeat-containing N-terminal plant-type domain-containing protein n=1 Tax=Rubus argutus TaxID=59490 RepID=A0AAW1W957_RUBAR
MKTFLPFFLLLITAVHSLQCNEDQQLSLLHFKKSLAYNSSVSSKLISWNSSTNCCSWIGVTCSTNGSVISLDISRESISSGIDNSSSLLDLQHLQSLNLASNNFVGTFPKEFFQVPSLETLDLSDNLELQGTLPEFPKNGSLRSLILRNTSFSGLLPNSLGNLEKLSTIDIEYCSFSGSIPRSIGNLTQLVQFFMSMNYFKGPVPSFSRAKNLAVIDLSFNIDLAGPINSTRCENLTDLVNLNLGYNLLDGNIPSALFSLPLLYSLDLSNNQFSGPFHQISNFSSCFLEFLDLSSNNLEGPIPISIRNVRGLQRLALGSNKLNGTFPISSLHQFRSLSYLDLSQNSLSLGLDATDFSYSSFPQFRNLYLATVKLRSPFPEFLRNQSRLKYLDLSHTQIHGKIPNWIWRINTLYLLNLSSNSLNLLEGPLLNPMPSSLRVLDLHSN